MANSTMTAGWRVANTFELLEQILLEVASRRPAKRQESTSEGIRTVLLSQRVCTSFRDVIKNSPLLQRELFLAKPVKTSDDEWHEWLNPLLCRSFQIAEGLKLRVDADAWWEEDGHSNCIWEVEFLCDRADSLKQIRHSAAEESWRKMYLFKGSYQVTQVMALRHYNRFIAGRARNPTVGIMFDAVFAKGHQLSSSGRDCKKIDYEDVEDWPN